LIELPDGCLLMAVADVMGKGVPAALFAATLRTLLRTATQWTSRASDLLRRINRLMYDELNAVDMFITVQVAIANLRQGVLHLASAGHNPLLYLGPDGVPKTAAPDGMPLGILPEVAFEEQLLPLQSLGAALLFTDGLTEARSTAGELFGQKRLAQWLADHLALHPTAAELAEGFQDHLAQFQGPNSPRDDQTFLILAQHNERLSPEPTGCLSAGIGTAK